MEAMMNPMLGGRRERLAARAAFALLIAGSSMAGLAQNRPGGSDAENTRGLWDTGLIQKRPAAQAAARPKPATYKPIRETLRSGKVEPYGKDDLVLGVTFWRLRPPASTDPADSRLLILTEEGKEAQEVPERIEAGTPLKVGEKIRLTIEVPRTGYLYVFDREQYADGKNSPAYLIYPNFQTRPGDNAVAAGRIIEVPDQRDKISYFRLRRGRPDQVGELLSVLVSPEPLDLKIGRDPLAIPDEQMAGWESKYNLETERFELEGGAGTVYTGDEKKAALGAAQMTRDLASPQTLYRVRPKAGQAVMLQLPVRITSK
jgi:hypothetical protein